MDNLEIRKTTDGSTTLFNKELNEHYHSIYGAVQEAMHIYINAGFLNLREEQNAILEIGFGTGLNALLSAKYALQNRKNIFYTSIELYPLPLSLIKALDFGIENSELLRLHKLTWGTHEDFCEYFKIRKIQADLLTYNLEQEQYDLVYYDAFAPDKQPEMWSENILKKVVDAMRVEAIFVTYSTKGIVKQMLRKMGLFVKRLPGPPGKKDMLYCVKKQ